MRCKLDRSIRHAPVRQPLHQSATHDHRTPSQAGGQPIASPPITRTAQFGFVFCNATRRAVRERAARARREGKRHRIASPQALALMATLLEPYCPPAKRRTLTNSILGPTTSIPASIPAPGDGTDSGSLLRCFRRQWPRAVPLIKKDDLAPPPDPHDHRRARWMHRGPGSPFARTNFSRANFARAKFTSAQQKSLLESLIQEGLAIGG